MAFGGFIHQERHCENNSYKETFVHECNALEFGTVSSSQKEVNNDNFPFLAATEPMKSCLFPASLQLPPEELGE
jgi:hypothetical protein